MFCRPPAVSVFCIHLVFLFLFLLLLFFSLDFLLLVTSVNFFWFPFSVVWYCVCFVLPLAQCYSKCELRKEILTDSYVFFIAVLLFHFTFRLHASVQLRIFHWAKQNNEVKKDVWNVLSLFDFILLIRAKRVFSIHLNCVVKHLSLTHKMKTYVRRAFIHKIAFHVGSNGSEWMNEKDPVTSVMVAWTSRTMSIS